MNKEMQRHQKWIVAVVAAAILIGAGLFAFRGFGPADVDTTAAASPQEGEGPKTGLAAYDENGDGIVYQAGMHPHIVRDEPGQCPICGMDLMPVRIDGVEEGTVKIDPVTLQNIGVRTARVEIEALGRTVRTTGRFEASEQGLAAVSPKVGGWVERLFVEYEGARVRRGQPLLEIYSPELVSTQEEYLLALRNAERLGGSPDAQRLVEAARRRLAYWDISDAQIRKLAETGTPTKTLTLYAPASGTVTEKNVVEGQQITPGQTLMQLSDLSRLWIMVDVYEQDLAWVGVGTEARITLPYEPGSSLVGRIDYLYDDLDPDTRTAKARITVQNPGLRLKPGMYATVHLVGGNTEPFAAVPEEALIRTGARDFVILALGEGRFRPQAVTAGAQADGKVQILAGLRGGEEVVTSAQFLIDSEARLQSALGAMAAGAQETATTPHAGTQESITFSEESPLPRRGESPGGGTSAPAVEARSAVQVVAISVGSSGFSPQQVELQAGRPARLVFTRKEEGGCTTHVQIPDFGVGKTALPLGEAVAIDLTPSQDGTYTFACGMDMVKGSIMVSKG